MTKNEIEYSELINGKTKITYKKDKPIKDTMIDTDLVIDSLKSKIKHEEGKIVECNKQIDLSELAINKCKDQIGKLVHQE